VDQTTPGGPGIDRTGVRDPGAVGGGQQRPGNPSSFVNGLNDVDGPGGIRDGPQVLEGRAKSDIDLTVTDRARTRGGGRRQPAAA
jgi:hypothetical protein